MANNWKQIGTAAVDSGQLLLIDPLYLNARWEKKEFEDIRQYRNLQTGAVLQYQVDFRHYDEIIPSHGKSMNALNATGGWEPIPVEIPPGLNYNAVCRTTLQGSGGGVVDGLGVAVTTGWGDGQYPVYVKRDEEGRIVQVLIDFEESEG